MDSQAVRAERLPERETQYVLIEVEGGPQVLRPGIQYTISNLDSESPTMTLSDGSQLVGTYTESFGSVMVLKALTHIEGRADARAGAAAAAAAAGAAAGPARNGQDGSAAGPGTSAASDPAPTVGPGPWQPQPAEENAGNPGRPRHDCELRCVTETVLRFRLVKGPFGKVPDKGEKGGTR